MDNNDMIRLSIIQSAMSRMIDHGISQRKEEEVIQELQILIRKHFPPSKTESTPPPGETT